MFELFDLQEEPDNLLSQQNSFWKVFIEKSREIKEFYEKNSENFEICLSGTGSSMFIKYDNHLEREKILKIIPANWRFFLAKPLQYSPLKSLDSNGV